MIVEAQIINLFKYIRVIPSTVIPETMYLFNIRHTTFSIFFLPYKSFLKYLETKPTAPIFLKKNLGFQFPSFCLLTKIMLRR